MVVSNERRSETRTAKASHVGRSRTGGNRRRVLGGCWLFDGGWHRGNGDERLAVSSEWRVEVIELNGVKLDEAELKAQLEAQGWICRQAPPPKIGHVWTRFALIGTGNCMTDDYAGYTIPDELIRAYEELYEAVKCMPRWPSPSKDVVGVLSSFVSIVDEIRDKIDFIKRRAGK
jgi:hypothetical protein